MRPCMALAPPPHTAQQCKTTPCRRAALSQVTTAPEVFNDIVEACGLDVKHMSPEGRLQLPRAALARSPCRGRAKGVTRLQ